MGKSVPDPPPPPDPTQTIAAQSQANEATARLQQQLGMTGTYGPGGSVTYRSDPNSPSGYSQYTNLDPSQQQIYDASTAAQAGAYGVANDQIARIRAALGQTLTTPDMQTGFDQGNAIQTSFDPGGTVRTSYNSGGPLNLTFNPGQAVQGSVGPADFGAQRDQVIDSEFNRARSRLDPMFAQAEEKERNRLANQGLSQNSSAYNTSIYTFNRGKNDAYSTALSDAVRAGGAEQDRLFNESLAQGGFANQAAGQQYNQNLGMAAFGNSSTLSDANRNAAAAGFTNQAVGQQYGQNQGMAAFGNTAGGQQFAQNQDAANFGNSARQMNFQNQSYVQNQPISQFATLMGTGGAVQMPGAYNGPVPGVNATDALGAYALNTQAQQNAYNQQVANVNSRNQAVSNLAGAVFRANPWNIFGGG